MQKQQIKLKTPRTLKIKNQPTQKYLLINYNNHQT